MKLIDLAWITGKLGQAGCGVSTVTEEVNGQGAADMGVAPEFLPGLIPFDDPAMRDKLAKTWESTLPAAGSGANLIEILERCRSGQIRALYVVGENPLETLPASMEVKAALDRLDLLVVQDPFLTHTGRSAHVVLPACTYAEKDGTFTNLEGRVLRVRQAMDTIGESVPDWHIMAALANGLGCPWNYDSATIFRRRSEAAAGYYKPGTARKSCDGGSYLSHGYVDSVAARYKTPFRQPAALHLTDGAAPLPLGQTVHGSSWTDEDFIQQRSSQDERIRYEPAGLA